jgi:ribosomal protein L7/L12
MDPDYVARLARLEAKVSYLLQHLGLSEEDAALADGGFATPVAGPVPGYGAAGSAIPPELAIALQRGRKIEAIKIYRTVTGAGLGEAKTAVEAMERELGLPQ